MINKLQVKMFINLEKASDTLDLTLLLDKLSDYGIRGIGNRWPKSHLCNCKQYISMNGFNSNNKLMKYVCLKNSTA